MVESSLQYYCYKLMSSWIFSIYSGKWSLLFFVIWDNAFLDMSGSPCIFIVLLCFIYFALVNSSVLPSER